MMSPAPLAQIFLYFLFSILLAQTPFQSTTPASQPRLHFTQEQLCCITSNSVNPIYPREARLAHIEGVVKLTLVISDENSKIVELQPVSGDPLLLESTMDAVRQWRFQIGGVVGGPKEIEIPLTFTFKIEDPPKPAFLHLSNGEVIRADNVREFTDSIEYTVDRRTHHISPDSVTDINACARVSVIPSPKEANCIPGGGPSFFIRAIPLLPAKTSHAGTSSGSEAEKSQSLPSGAIRQNDPSTVSVSLPANVPIETVQIFYFLIGPFGGYGGYAEQRPGLHSYEIPTMVEGKAASEVRMIVYASGCEMNTFTLSLTGHSKIKQNFECQRAATVHLWGKIAPSNLARESNAEVVVSYMALWAHEFFGIRDGMVSEFQLATVSPDSQGAFDVDLPYFAADVAAAPFQRKASFSLKLCDSETGNLIAYNLTPTAPDLRLEEPALRILARYPDVVEFTPEH
jgi:TonB family protein